MKPHCADKMLTTYLESGICVAASGGGGVMVKRNSGFVRQYFS